jgi:hypothetical protein
VVRRGRDSWQIGLDPRRRVIIPDREDLHDELDALRHGTAASEPAGLSQSLAEAGLLSRPRPRSTRIEVRGTLGRGTRALLETFGVRTSKDSASDIPGLLLSVGEPDRELLDPWLREGRSHLVVRVVDGRVVIGPFVERGRGACLRCIDCHLVDIEPEHYAVLHRYVHTPREDGFGDEIPALTRHLALSWALSELATYADGLDPVSLSSTLALSESGLESTTWHRHPECACSWSGTIAS